MRNRRWVLVVAIIGGVFILGGYFGWRITRADEKLKTLILAQVRPFLSQESDIEKVQLDLSSLHLRGVKLASKDRTYTLEIEDVRFNYKLINLLWYRLVPYKITHEVVLFRPSIRIRKDTWNNSEKVEEERWLHFQDVFRKLDNVKRITVVDASFYIEDSLGESIRLAHSMNGWLKSSRADSAMVRLAGGIMESKNSNLKMEGTLNLLSGRPIWLNIQLKRSEVGNELPFLLPDYIQMTSGNIHGDITYSEKDKLSGFLEIQDGLLTFRKANLNFHDVSIKTILNGKNLDVQGEVADFNGSSLTISGKMENILDPVLDLKVESSRFQFSSFFSKIAPDYNLPVFGRAHVDVSIRGSFNHPVVQGRFSSTNLKTYGVSFDHFNTVMRIENGRMTLEGQGGNGKELFVKMNGSMNFLDSLYMTSLSLNLQGDIIQALPVWMKTKLEACISDMELKASGSLRNLSGEANGHMSLAVKGGEVIQLKPHLKYKNHTLSAHIASNNTFFAEGTIFHPFREDNQYKFHVDGIENIYKLILSKDGQVILSDLAFQGDLRGSSGEWEIETQGYRLKQGERTNVFEGILSWKKDKKRKDKIHLQATYFASMGESMPLVAQGTLSKEAVQIDACSVGDFLSIKGTYPFQTKDPLDCSIQLFDLSLEQLHNLIPQARHYFGQLRGNIEISGTREQPGVDMKLILENGEFHSEKDLEGIFEYRLSGGMLKKCHAVLTQGDKPILQGMIEGSEGDTLSGRFYGEDIDFEKIGHVFSENSPLAGRGNFDVHISGTSKSPRLMGSLELANGFYGPLSFHQLTAELSDTFSVEYGFKGGMLSIRRGQIDREDGLKVLVWGDIAHDRDKESDISILAEGNVLGWLPEAVGFFKKAEGTGEIFFRFAGKQGEWVLGSGRIRLDGGQVELAHYLKKIDDLQIQAELQQGERLFSIANLSGVIENRKFVLTNSNWNKYETTVSPLLIEKFGVHLGALQLTTEDKGIHVHLPGFMERGDRGWLSFKGKTPNEPFLITGPSESPLISGTIGLTSTRLTYPFLEVEMDSEDLIIDFLGRVDWDIFIYPNKDVRYIRDIETPMGNVYADLQLRDGHGGINLQGIIRDKDYQVWGDLVSTEGSLEALDHLFRPERITFDYPKGSRDPIITGRTFTTVIDSLGMPSTVWLTMISTDEVSGLEKQGGPWKKIQFRFSTDNPNLARSEADLLAALGYSSSYMKDRAYDAIGLQLENLFFRPLIRPLERGLRRHLGLDVVRFSSMFSRNIIQLQMGDRLGFDPWHLFRSARLTLGKYLTRGLFITYSGKIHNMVGFQYPQSGVGFRHAIALEYSIRPDLFLEMEYTYDSQLLSDRREDKRIWLRHIFPF